MADVTLRYFDCVGRAQPLRHALTVAGVSFDDVRVPMEKWPELKGDRAFAGPYAGLPTLRWGDDLIVETLPVASYVARRLGQYEGRSAAEIAALEAIVSCSYVEVTLPVGLLIWSDIIWPGVDVDTAYGMHMARLIEKLQLLDATLPEHDDPLVADFFADEAFAVARYLIGPDNEDALRDRLPRLAALHDRLAPRVAALRDRRPARFTSRPDEAKAVARFHAIGGIF